ncbi:hypothetical protein T10_1187 [Trichinella papuae]|uniref:Uncharacterized protein n=1 Tax=Trichinella papuae TaxID=268474 RepID=A0A0V1N2F2_9BILA|nr:hypothetical protein T10_1187 [Trichinella papuae]
MDPDHVATKTSPTILSLCTAKVPSRTALLLRAIDAANGNGSTLSQKPLNFQTVLSDLVISSMSRLAFRVSASCCARRLPLVVVVGCCLLERSLYVSHSDFSICIDNIMQRFRKLKKIYIRLTFRLLQLQQKWCNGIRISEKLIQLYYFIGLCIIQKEEDEEVESEKESIHCLVVPIGTVIGADEALLLGMSRTFLKLKPTLPINLRIINRFSFAQQNDLHPPLNVLGPFLKKEP